MSAESEILFEAATPLGFTACVTRARWEIITTLKHPVMAGCRSFLITTYPTGKIKEGERIWPT